MRGGKTKIRTSKASGKSRLRMFLKIALYIFVWLCIWIPMAVVIALPLLLMLIDSFGEDPNSLSSQGANTMVGIVCVGTGLALFFVVWLMRNRKSLFARTGRRVLQVCTVIGIIGGVIISAAGGWQPETPQVTQQQVVAGCFARVDSDLVALLQQTGAAQLDDLCVEYVDGYSHEVDRVGEYQSFLGQAEAGGKIHGEITVKRGIEAEELKRVLAHEYLHHIWFTKMTEADKSKLTNYLIVMYGNDWYMKQRTNSSYANNGILSPSELFSFYCTEVSDRFLDQAVLEECNRYIVRSALTMIR